MGNINVAVDWALAQQGRPYRNDAGRFGPDHFDCSGLVVAALRHAGIAVPGGVDASPTLCRWGMNSGTIIDLGLATATRGALLIRGGLNGWGASGHVCFSLGDGRTMEAMGTAYGCRIGHAQGRGWSHGMRVPGADYSPVGGYHPPHPPTGNHQPTPAVNLVGLARAIQDATHHVLRRGDHGPYVGIAQQLLRNKGYARAGAVDHNPMTAVFGPATEGSVRDYQTALNAYLRPSPVLAVDGIIGPATWYWLAR